MLAIRELGDNYLMPKTTVERLFAGEAGRLANLAISFHLSTEGLPEADYMNSNCLLRMLCLNVEGNSHD